MATFEPIGFVRADQQYKYQQPRQGEFARNRGTIELNRDNNFEQALDDLEGFSYIWVIYQFHHNEGWRPKVNVPVSPDGKKKGLFATRSPYRPNPIGLSCVKLKEIRGLTLEIEDFDLLDGTPILDIKPYVSHYDSHPEASTGWLPQNAPQEYDIIWNEISSVQSQWIIDHHGPDLFDLVRVQLALDPLNQKRKRVQIQKDNSAELAYRTWRIRFRVIDQAVAVEQISSGYSNSDLAIGAEDRWEDKDLHRTFVAQFPKQ